jgi:hypothetical protein
VARQSGVLAGHSNVLRFLDASLAADRS